MTTEYILGLPVDKLSLTGIIEELPERLKLEEKTLYLSVNPQIALHAKDYPEIMALAEEASHRLPDGIGMVKASKRQGGKITERVTGIDLMVALLDFANKHGESIFLYGAHPDVLKQLVAKIKSDYESIRIAGAIDGYTTKTEAEIATAINQAKPTFVFVALGFPKQEQWLARNYQHLDCKVFQDVGGSFDVLSGTVKRAPELVVKMNLEWVYRSVINPKRLYRMIEIPQFMYQAAKWHRKNKNQ